MKLALMKYQEYIKAQPELESVIEYFDKNKDGVLDDNELFAFLQVIDVE